MRRNKLASLIIFFLLLLVFKNYFLDLRQSRVGIGGLENEVSGMPKLGMPSILPPLDNFAPTETQNRLVIQESSVSMVIANVHEGSNKIIDQAKNLGGYMVNTSLTNPEEAPFATVTVRVPADQLGPMLDYLRSLAVKVTSENILGTDVTDEYVDIQARLTTLEKTKAKFEEILSKATQVQDILMVQRELVSLQDQIDSLKGRQQYLEQTAKLAKLTAYLSTDELALPYAPAEKFRPNVVFKLAVRSLVSSLRGLAETLIWVLVYGAIWIPFGSVVYLIWRRRKNRAA